MNKYGVEMNECRNKIKNDIEKFINLNELEKAKNLIQEYEKIITDDIDIYSMKAVIAIKENRLDDSEKVLNIGMQIDKNNFDLIYNTAYLFELKNNIPFAIRYYNKAIQTCNDNHEIKKKIVNIMEELNSKIAKDVDRTITSIVILTYNNLEYTKLCIDSIRQYTHFGTYEIIVVDNNSSDGTIEWLENQNNIKVIFNNQNLGFPKGCNQGIEVAIGDYVLLLNNDTVVTPNWLENLKVALNSNENVGAVGAITNSCSNNQVVYVDYKNTNEMIEFATKNNVSDSSKWEERLRLVGFCMLIKNTVIDKIGLLDEIFTPGNFEDDDYSYRIREAGYKLILCKDCFIHHFGSASFGKDNEGYNSLLNTNRHKFKDKWGFDPVYSSFVRYEIINLIDEPEDKNLKVLEIGCACGATLMEIKNRYENAKIYGIELNENAANIAKLVADVKAENIENEYLNYDEKYFDYIIFADVLEHLYDPWTVLKNMKRYLSTNGKILASIPNVMHYTVVRNLLNGNWTYEDAGILDETHVRFFTLNEVNKMFIKTGYKVEGISATTLQSSEQDLKFIDELAILSNETVKNQFNAYQYIIKAGKEIEESLNNLKNNDSDSAKKKFVTIFPETDNSHLTKDVGMIPYIMYKNFNFDSKIVCYKNGEYPYLKKEVKGLKIEFIDNSGDANLDVKEYLIKNADNIDILHIFHLYDIRTLNWISIYKTLNPNGKVYLKLDANINITKLQIDANILEILKMCTLISVETKYLYKYLNENWGLAVQYIPNGFYDFGKKISVNYSEKENTICTVGRIGLNVKANEILLEAFKIAASELPNWKLKVIGPICEEFKPVILQYFNENPELIGRVIFTGEIQDKQQLETEYRKAKIFCLTSRSESFGIVFVEAAKNGCFLISSNIIPAWDITDNKKYGDIFEIDNIDELSKMLVYYAKNDKRLEENSTKIQKFAYENFDWKIICANINKFLSAESTMFDIESDYEFNEIKRIVIAGQENNDPNDRVFIERLCTNVNAFKMEFWQNHFELEAVKNYPEITGKMIDFGCGTGHMDILLAREGRKIYGVDLSPIGINIANYLKDKEIDQVKNNLKFSIEDITKMPQADQLYDSVWCCHVLEHIENIEPVIKGLRKRVKLGSHMLVSVPLGYAYDDPDHVNHFFNKEQLQIFLEQHIEVVRIDVDNGNQVLRALCKFSN